MARALVLVASALLAAPAGGDPTPGPTRTPVHVVDHYPGSGSYTNAIQSAIAAACQRLEGNGDRCGTVVLPAGQIDVDATITIGSDLDLRQHHGLRIVGQGAGETWAYAGLAGTVIRFTTRLSTDAVFTVKGSRQVSVEDFAVIADDNDDGGADYCFRWVPASANARTVGHRVRRVSCGYADVAGFAIDGNPQQAEAISIEDVWINTTPVALRVNNTNAQNLVFRNAQAIEIRDHLIELIEGGVLAQNLSYYSSGVGPSGPVVEVQSTADYLTLLDSNFEHDSTATMVGALPGVTPINAVISRNIFYGHSASPYKCVDWARASNLTITDNSCHNASGGGATFDVNPAQGTVQMIFAQNRNHTAENIDWAPDLHPAGYTAGLTPITVRTATGSYDAACFGEINLADTGTGGGVRWNLPAAAPGRACVFTADDANTRLTIVPRSGQTIRWPQLDAPVIVVTGTECLRNSDSDEGKIIKLVAINDDKWLVEFHQHRQGGGRLGWRETSACSP